jgi:hypothetical protein
MYIDYEGHFSNHTAPKEAKWVYVPRRDRDQLLSWADDAFELHTDKFKIGPRKDRWEPETQ